MTTLIQGISSMATRRMLDDLARDLPRDDIELRFESVGGVDAARRVAAGEVFDLVVLAADAMATLAAAGHLAADSLRDVVHSPMAIAVAAGGSPVDVGSEAALREAVLQAQGIGHSTGPSGVALMALFERWGITPLVEKKLMQAPPGVPVGGLIANGSVDLGFQQLSELMGMDGITVLGTMPAGVEIVTTFAGAVGASSNEALAARRVLSFLCSDAASDTKLRYGMVAA